MAPNFLKRKDREVKFKLVIFAIYFGFLYYVNLRYSSVVFDFFLTFIFHFPYFYKKTSKIKSSLIMSLEMLFDLSLVLADINFSTTLFFAFLHMTIIFQLIERNQLVIITIISEFYFVFNYPHTFTNQNIIFIVCSIIPEVSFYFVLKDDEFQRQMKGLFYNFPSKIMIACMLVDIIIFRADVDKKIFPISIILAFVDYPDFLKYAKFTKGNVFSFLYIMCSLSINIYGVTYGVNNGASSLISSSTLSLYNTISLAIVLAGDLNSRLSPDKRFSFGYKYSTDVFHFVNSLIILFSAFNLWTEFQSSALSPVIYVKRPFPLVLISACDFLLTLIGAVTIGHTKITTFTILNDIFNSSAALISSLFDSIFNLPQADHLISAAIVITIFTTAMPELAEAARSLFMRSSEKMKHHLISRFSLDEKNTDLFFIFSNPHNQLVIKTKMLEENRETFVTELTHYCTSKNIELTLEFI